jgi:hypothetical protein
MMEWVFLGCRCGCDGCELSEPTGGRVCERYDGGVDVGDESDRVCGHSFQCKETRVMNLSKRWIDD